ncbi:hypothetical protein SAMN05444165_2217 [Paraburkholderia phenazinium]|jgi:hypothetical protein|uniref:Uncharacterized protein n=2 Tax=Burkholderiaceae TaxID=119060 RepID=A0A1N6IJA2_9BURK|nr:hypothetical protein SAMN05444165_2217 [Paraburkholderia phenazinium]
MRGDDHCNCDIERPDEGSGRGAEPARVRADGFGKRRAASVGSMKRLRPYPYPSPRRMLAGLKLVVLSGALAGCSDGISPSDVQFVVSAMPSQFESLRMYHTTPDNAAPFGSAAPHGPVRLQQGCEAILRLPGGEKREAVILDSGTEASFDLDAIRTDDGWNVTSDGLSPPSDNPVAFRTQLTNCVSAIEDKYRAEPDKAPFSEPLVFK